MEPSLWNENELARLEIDHLLHLLVIVVGPSDPESGFLDQALSQRASRFSAQRDYEVSLRLAGADMLLVFEEWRGWRRTRQAGLARNDLAAYYARNSFPHDLLEFVETQYLSEA